MNHEFKVGDRVYHPEFGKGTIQNRPAPKHTPEGYVWVLFDGDQFLIGSWAGYLEPLYCCSICGREVPESELAPGNLSWCAGCELS